ncbi:MAG: hypothetical protein JWN34_5896, partial [Bryobacterales bacterium]|nr:hypothetical protein [Bryobacterales bacterium]
AVGSAQTGHDFNETLKPKTYGVGVGIHDFAMWWGKFNVIRG